MFLLSAFRKHHTPNRPRQARSYRPCLEVLEDRLVPTSVSLVADIHPNGSSGPNALTNVTGTLFFQANDNTGDVELYQSDGTEAGTAMIQDINRGGFTLHMSFKVFDGALYFGANDGVHGLELWRSDGTAGGTALVKDLLAGPGGSAPAGLVNVGGRLFFAANGGATGSELWTSDGSRKGTRLVQDIAAGTSWSMPGELTATEEGLYFSANDGAHGRELWVLPAAFPNLLANGAQGIAVGTLCKRPDTAGSLLAATAVKEYIAPNEPNQPRFWRPQSTGRSRTSPAPASTRTAGDASRCACASATRPKSGSARGSGAWESSWPTRRSFSGRSRARDEDRGPRGRPIARARGLAPFGTSGCFRVAGARLRRRAHRPIRGSVCRERLRREGLRVVFPEFPVLLV